MNMKDLNIKKGYHLIKTKLTHMASKRSHYSKLVLIITTLILVLCSTYSMMNN